MRYNIGMRINVRQMMLLLAACALALAAVRPSGPRPGVYLAAFGHGLGACRNDGAGVFRLGDGRDGGACYELGVWDRRSVEFIVLGLEVRDGRAILRAGSAYWIAW